MGSTTNLYFENWELLCENFREGVVHKTRDFLDLIFQKKNHCPLLAAYLAYVKYNAIYLVLICITETLGRLAQFYCLRRYFTLCIRGLSSLFLKRDRFSFVFCCWKCFPVFLTHQNVLRCLRLLFYSETDIYHIRVWFFFVFGNVRPLFYCVINNISLWDFTYSLGIHLCTG